LVPCIFHLAREVHVKTRGMAYLGLFEFVKKEFGKQALLNLLEGLVEFPEMFIRDIEAYQWYPSDVFNEAVECLVTELGNGDISVARRFGRFLCDMYASEHPVDMIAINTETPGGTPLESFNRLWLIYHDRGSFTQTENEIYLDLDKDMSLAYMNKIAGFTERYLEIAGISFVSVEVYETKPNTMILKM